MSVIQLHRRRHIADARAALDVVVDVLVRLRQVEHELRHRLLQIGGQCGAHRPWPIGNLAGLPDDVDVRHLEHLLVDHRAQVAAGIALGLFTLPGCPGDRAVVLLVQHGHDPLLMAAGKADLREIRAVIELDALRLQSGARDQVARGGIGIGEGQRMALHLLDRLDPRIRPHDHDRVVECRAVVLLRHDDRLDAFAVEPGAGKAGRAEARHLELARGDALHHAGIVGRREQLHRDAELLLQQLLELRVALQAVLRVLAAQQADAELLHLVLVGIGVDDARQAERQCGGDRHHAQSAQHALVLP